MRSLKILIICLISNVLFISNSVNAAVKQPTIFTDEKIQLSYLQKGKILPKDLNIEGTITNIEFMSWLQYFTYDEEKKLRSKFITDDQKTKLVSKALKLDAIYQKWEKSGSLKKQLTYYDMMSILYQLIGYEKLSETQLNQVIELENVMSKEEINFVTKNTTLKKKTAAVLFARFIRQFQTNQYATTGQTITSDSTLFLTEGPSSNFQHIIEIPKRKSYMVITKLGNIIVAKFNGKIGFLSKSIQFSFEKNIYKTNANKVNMRLGPSTSHPIIKVVNQNEQLEGRQFNSEWVQISSNNGKAFISSKYVIKVDAPQKNNENKDDTENLVKKVYVLADKLNIRAEQSVTSSIIGSVFKGDELVLITKYTNWSKIKYKKLVGFVSNDYISIKSNSLDKTIVIAIDAGHGGKDPGTHFKELNEKNITLDTALKIKQSFELSNVQVVLTRESDVFLDLGERVRIAKQNKAILFVSIHVNSGSGSNGGGSETYYYGNNGKNPFISESQLLASSIQKEMIHAWDLADRGVQHGNFQVIRDNSMPAVLTELGFIDSKKDQVYLSSSEQLTIIAEAIHDGIVNYLQTEGYNVKQSS